MLRVLSLKTVLKFLGQAACTNFFPLFFKTVMYRFFQTYIFMYQLFQHPQMEIILASWVQFL